MKTFTTLLNCLGVFIVSYNCLSAPQNNQKPKFSDHHIDRLVEKGQFDKALKCIEKVLPTCKKDKKRTYNLLSKKSMIHLFDDEVNDFMEAADLAFKVFNKRNSIYQSLYFAKKSTYFHYYSLGDSAMIYADKAINLLHKNWKYRAKTPTHFIYQVYATSYLYRPRKELNSVPNISAYLKNFKIYFDSALISYNDKIAYPQEKAMIYKSHANRVFDIIGYNIKRSELDFLNYAVQQHYLTLPIDLYNKALACLPHEEQNYRYGNIALKALFYHCSNREKLGDDLLEPVIARLYKNPAKMMGSRLNNSLYVVQYFAHSIIHENKYDPRIKKVQHIYEQILPIWEQRISKLKKIKRDQYVNSPYSVLSLIDYWLFKRNLKILNREAIVLRTLQSYHYYSRYSEESFHHILNAKQVGLKSKYFSIRTDKFFSLKTIQKKLRNNEAILMKSPRNLGKELFILVTKQHVFLDTDIRSSSKYNDLISYSDLKKFKHLAYQNFKSMPFAEILKSGMINKLYTVIELHENFDAMITDTLGDSFEKLSYFKQKINLVKIYNPIDFIHSSSTHYNMIARSRDGLLLNQKSNNTPYSFGLLHRLQFTYIDTVATEKLFQQVGILHITGHNQAFDPSISTWETSAMHEVFDEYMYKNEPRKFRDLIVLNSCFGSFKRMGFYPDRDLHNNLISRGAKAVIASPYQTVDQSSAYIFEKFYTYLDQGITAEDALQKAKMDYLKTHNGSLAHPIYWSTYELTTNVKALRMARKPKPFPWEWIPIFTFLFGVGGAAWWSMRR